MVKAGFKQTDAGVIPEGWDCVELNDVCERISVGLATSVTKYYRSSGVPIIRNLNIKDGYFDGSDMLYLDPQFAKSNSTKAAKTLDVLTVHTGANLGQSCVLPDEYDNCQTFTTLITTPKKRILDSQYLCAYFSSYVGRNEMSRLEVGGAKGNLNTGDLKRFKLKLPSISEQRAIAEALSDVDGLIAGLDKLIAKKRAVKQAAMQQLLTGKTRLPGFGNGRGYKQTEIGQIPEDWDVVTLESVCIQDGLVRGPFGGALKKEFFVKYGYKVYEQRNAIYATTELGSYFVDDEKYRELSRFKINPGDFIVSCSGTIGRIFQIPENAPEGIINQALLKIVLDPKSIDNQFFLSLFRWEPFQERIIDNSHGGAMQNLVGMDIFRNTLIQFPQLIEQKAIAEILSDMEAEITALETRRAKTQAIKQGMMQELLTGRTRLL